VSVVFRSRYHNLVRNRHFRWFTVGTLIVQLGVQFSWIALSWYVLQTTSSAAKIGMVLAAYPVASIFTSPVIGVLMDKWSRKALMMADNALQCAIFILLPALAWLHQLPFPLLFAFVLLAGALSPLSVIGRNILLPNLVTAEELEAANAFTQLRMNVVALLGPAAGGVLVSWVGALWTMIITALCFGVYVVCLANIPAARYGMPNGVSADAHAESWRERMFGGWVFLMRAPLLLLLAVVTLFFNLTYGPLEPALPVMVSSVYRAGASTLGLVWTAFAVGALIGTTLWGYFEPRWPMRVVVPGIILCWGVFSGLIAWTHNAWQAMALLFLGGLTYAPYNILYLTLQQRLVADEHRGKVYGVINSLTYAGLPVGQLLGGVLISAVGAPATILAGGIACVALGVLVFAANRPWQAEANASVERSQTPAH
jgi:predicted MFS family arabinose efflux permease